MKLSESDQVFNKAKHIALRLLRVRPRSAEEIRERLRYNKIPNKVIEQTIVFLKEASLIDDHKFTREWIRLRLTRPFGFRRIILELKKKGIAQHIIEQAIETEALSFDENGAVEELAEQRAKKYKNIDPLKRKKRLFDYLSRRGFQYAAIQKAINKF